MYRKFIGAACVLFALAACNAEQAPIESEQPAQAESTESVPTESGSETTEPEPTEAPLAARVNDEDITLANYELEVLRYEAGFAMRGVDPGTQGDYRATVLEQVITDVLIAQAAVAAGFTVEQGEIQTAYDQSVADAGGEAGFQEWLDLNMYTADDYRERLGGWLLANKVQTQIVSTVPETAEQVHARHILVATEEEAQAIREQILAGADFATLAVNNSRDQSTRINGGDLGWFPRGVLTVPEVEEVAFGQTPGALSEVVSTFLGFHIVETLEFDAARSLSSEARLVLQQAAIDAWLAGLRDAATIERFVP